jgi:3-methyladenine DNA glycosylase AlkD
MTPAQLIFDIREYCKSNANDENVKKYSRFFKEDIKYKGYGLSAPLIYSKVKELLKNPSVTIGLVLKASEELIKSENYEEPTFALLLLDGKHKQFTKDIFNYIETFFAISIRNWAHADTLGMFLLPKFLKQEIITIKDFKKWIKSPYKFQRRCVPVTFIKHIKEHKSDDFNPFFNFIEPLMTDKEREVHQGVGWFLREAWKIQPEATEKFLLLWKNNAPRLIFQYATEKMSKEMKNRFKKDKVV